MKRKNEERLKFLKWPALQQRRLFSSLTECHKTINRLIELKFASATLNSFKHSVLYA